jgi:DNA-binding PadR family transcriptional regulator
MSATADPTALLPLHPLAFQVLLILMEGECHGYGIAKAIEAKDARLGRIYPTNLYRRLRDMVRDGLIQESKAAGDDGSRRSTFEITQLGRQVAVEEAHRLESAVADARRYKLLAQRSGDQ